jgi:hypothetical protein
MAEMMKMDDEELLWKDYERQVRQAEYYENSARGNVTTFLLTISAIVISLTKIGDNGLEQKDLWIAFLLVVLGVFGSIFNLKMHSMYCHHRNRARELRKLINGYHKELETKIENALELADSDSKKKADWLNWFRLYKLWVFLSSLISIIGFIMILVILAKCGCS